MTRRVWIAEDEDRSPDGWFLLGTFSGYLDDGGNAPADEFAGLSADEAIAWGRERSDVVLIRLGASDCFSAGDVNPEPSYEPWPPPNLPRLVRRRSAHEAWKDRSDFDPPIDWRVVVELTPPGFGVGERFSLDIDHLRAGWEATVVQIAERSGAESWGGESLNGFIADVRRQELEAGGEEYGWTTSHSPAYELQLVVSASTAAAAQSEAVGRMGDVSGWGIEASTEPLVPLPRGFYVG